MASPSEAAPVSWHFPDLGELSTQEGFVPLVATSDDRFRAGEHGVEAIAATGDRKVEFVGFGGHTMAHVKSAMGYPAYYPVQPVELRHPVKAVLMDLDGTSVHSESFWMLMIQMATASVLGNPRFELEEADVPYVSGHSVSEHLQYCLDKYAPGAAIEEARRYYFEHTHRELREISEGRGRPNAFQPTPGLKPFLLELKARGIKIAVVTSGLYEKAWPEIVSAFQTLELGDPGEFYDAIITAGFPLRKGEAGTLGELSPKPHPWLYAEACRVGLGLGPEERHHVVGIEDSGAGVCSIRLAGFTTIGFAGGNIETSGTKALCHAYCGGFEEVLGVLG